MSANAECLSNASFTCACLPCLYFVCGAPPLFDLIVAQEPSFSTKDHRGPRMVDYIWLGGSVRLQATLALPYEGQGDDFARMPNLWWPSDHIALGAQIILPARKADE